MRVTAPHDFGIYLIDHLLINFSARYPKISVELDLSNRFVDLVNEGIDVGVRATSGNLRESSLVVSVLGPTRLRLFASPEWIKKYGLPTSVQALQSLPVIWKIFGNRRHPTSWHLKNIQSEKEINIEVPIKSVIRTNDMLAAKHSAKAGFGIALLPKIACLTEVKRGELINILPEWGQDEGQIYAVYPSRRHLPAKTRAFVEYLKETFQRD